MSPELKERIDHIKAMRGDPKHAVGLFNAVSRFIANAHTSTRWLCRGEVRIDGQGWYPAALSYNPASRQIAAWAASGKDGKIEAHHEALFWPDGNLAGSCREVFGRRRHEILATTVTIHDGDYGVLTPTPPEKEPTA